MPCGASQGQPKIMTDMDSASAKKRRGGRKAAPEHRRASDERKKERDKEQDGPCRECGNMPDPCPCQLGSEERLQINGGEQSGINPHKKIHGRLRV